MKSGALLLLCVALHAQPRMEITGKVVEPGTNLGIYDATVIVSRMESRGPTLTEAHIEVAKLTTNAQGDFRYTVTDPGRYRFEAVKKDFQAIMTRSGMSNQVTVAVNAEIPRREVALVLGQNGTVTGRVLDTDSDEPVSNVSILLSGYSPSNPFGLSGLSRTDQKGAFTAQVTPGRYVVEIRPTLERMLKVFDEKDAAATDVGYRQQFFPEAVNFTSALPIIVSSRGAVDLGTIRIRKQPLFRVRVKTGGACSPDQTVAIEGSPVNTAAVACGGELLFVNMEPRSYTFTGRIGKTPAEMLTGTQAFEIRGSNQQVTLTLARGVDVSGLVVAAEGAGKVPVGSLKLELYPRANGFSPFDLRRLSSDADGQFRSLNMPMGSKQVRVVGLDTQFYVKQIRFNGSPAAGGIFDLTGNASLEIEIDSQPAAFTGTVMDHDKPVPAADLVLLRPDDPSFPRHITADDNGAFRILGLAPGEYRYFAVAAAARERAEEPSAWAGLVTAAEKAVLSRGAAQTVTVKLSEVSR